MTDTITAAVLVIGDEILSGRTKDKNIGYIADYLTQLGIDLKEVRIVPDEEEPIIEALNALRTRHTYVFTTGGIGPTHDDITADCVAKAFGVTIDHDPRAVAMLAERFSNPADLNEARLRMARIPAGADLVANAVSKAPGFHIGNVFVMAGVPIIMQAMLDVIGPQLARGKPLIAITIEAMGLKEGDIGTAYGVIAKAHPQVIMGSYPGFSDKGIYTRLVLRARDAALLEPAKADVIAMVRQAVGEGVPIEVSEGF